MSVPARRRGELGRDLHDVEARFLVGPAERHELPRRDAGQRHRGFQLAAARFRIGRGRLEAARLRVGQAARRAVRQVDDSRLGKAPQQRPARDRLVVGMRHDERRAERQRPVRRIAKRGEEPLAGGQ